MLVIAVAVIALQQASISISVTDSGTSVKVRARNADSSAKRDVGKPSRPALVATPAQLASAFADDGARELLARARIARLAQDSSLQSYDVATLQRLSIGMAFTRFGRDRLLFRSDESARVRWARGVGAQIDVTGKRSAVPMLGGSSDVDIESFLSPVPYYPGRDALWFGLARSREDASEADIVHPLARSAEAIYTYASGDSVSFRLPDGQTIQLRELLVRPRKPEWHAVVGSLWFDTSTGQLVRAAYRMSQSYDFVQDDSDKPGFVTRAILRPARAGLEGLAVEYGLYQGRFWLPRTQVAELSVQVGFVRTPVRLEEKYTYASVNALDTLPIIPPRQPPADTVKRTPIQRDSVLRAAERTECARTGEHTVRVDRYGRSLPVMVHVPCDTAALAHSPTLPGSIFDPADAVFGDAERDALLARAESMMPSVPFIPQPPRVDFGLDLLRYNRVEGASVAIDVTEMLAPGTSLTFEPRVGTADRVFDAELSLARSNGQGTRGFGIYRRLSAVNDWGHPLSFGSGLSAFLFGRDEGFYYRAEGAEATGDNLFGHDLEWRVFSERQSDAIARTNVSVPRVFGAGSFDPSGNIDAQRLKETGASIRKISTFGLDPDAFRLFSDLRVEGAGGDQSYGRAALDLTVSHPLGRALHRDFSAAVTAGAGTSAGALPVQRNWYLGGTNSVRGQPAGAMAGDSYWLTRTEVGYGSAGFRRMLFADIGWAGDRHDWANIGRPASGAGLGFSFMDGLIRTDIARGIYPTKQWHSALYFEARY
jgi:hypothetical protein